jgi:hypothetical protein
MTRVTHRHIGLTALATPPQSTITTKCVVLQQDRGVFGRHHECASEHWLLPRCFAEEYSPTCCTYVCIAYQVKINRHQSPVSEPLHDNKQSPDQPPLRCALLGRAGARHSVAIRMPARHQARRLRRHGRRGMAGHRSRDRLRSERSRYDRNVLGIVVVKCGGPHLEHHVDR